MSASLDFTLTIRVPDEIDPFTWFEIEGDADDVQDDTPVKMIVRWLGGTLSAAESWVANSLPDGWSCEISGPLLPNSSVKA